MRETLWKLDGVSLAAGPRDRLAETSLVVRRGVTAVLGRSGAGKTSLLNLLVGFEKPTKGRCVFLGDPRSNGHSQGPGLFWSPGDWGLWPHLTARAHLEKVAGKPDHTDELLRRFDLADRADARPDKLSAGECSRLAVARALASGASVLVLDEPLAHVDPAGFPRYWDAIRAWREANGASIVFSTHSPAAALTQADRAIVLRDGKVLAEGEVRELYHRPASVEAAESFGACNWFAPGEAARWLGQGAADGCLRPERLRVEPAEACAPSEQQRAAVVEWSRFGGAESELGLRHESGGETRRFVHRGGGFDKGRRVVLRVLATLMLASWVALLTGCGEDARAEKPLRFKAVRHFTVPPEGTKAPAPRSVGVGPGKDELLVLDTAGRVLVYGHDGAVKRSWFMPEYSVGRPEGVCVMADGRIAVGDTHYHRVVIFNPDGTVAVMLGSYGTEPGKFIYPVAVTTDPTGHLYVAEYGSNDRVQKFKPDGTFVASIGTFGPAPDQLQRPSGIAWRDGKLYIADAINHRIQIYEDTGKFVGTLGAASPGKPALDLRFPYDLRFASDGTLWIAEYGQSRLTHVTADGELLGHWGSPGAGDDQLLTPWGMAIDPRGHLWVADTGNRRMVEVEP